MNRHTYKVTNQQREVITNWVDDQQTRVDFDMQLHVIGQSVK